jgi:hypothetical protein
MECASSACAFESGSRALPLTRISLCEALKARDSTAQGKAAQQPQPWDRTKKTKPCKGGTGCFALAGLNHYPVLFPRVPLRSTLGFAVPRFQRFNSMVRFLRCV